MTTQNKIEFISNELNKGFTRLEFENMFLYASEKKKKVHKFDKK